MTINTRIVAMFTILLGFLFVISVTMFLMAKSNNTLIKAEANRTLSTYLSEHLRHTSDNLTQMARTYSVTGDDKYEKYFYEILGIRDGIISRPENYDQFYWGRVISSGRQLPVKGKPVSLLSLMTQAGFSDVELEKLSEAKKQSDDLTSIEKIAFNAMKGFFADEVGNFTVKGDMDPKLAIRVLHSKEYHAAKMKIMKPIAEFEALLSERIGNKIALIQSEVTLLQNIALILIAASIAFAIFSFFHIRQRVISPIIKLSTIAKQIENGELNIRADVLSSDELGILNHSFNRMIEKTQSALIDLKTENINRQQAEQDLLIAHDELEEKVQVRTQELEKEIMQRTKATEMAIEANNAKSDFLASMSHELRTPLNAILGFSGILITSKSDTLTERQIKQVEQIIVGGEHLLELINQVLDLSKIEAGQKVVFIESISLSELIEECLSYARILAKKNNISLESNIDATLSNVMADRMSCKQALVNLISNAIKYNRENGSVWVHAHEVDGNHLRINVVDTGHGIPQNMTEMVFEPFNRLNAESSQIEGTGIGLTLTKKLVEAMNGEIGFSSIENKSSTFWIELPISED